MNLYPVIAALTSTTMFIFLLISAAQETNPDELPIIWLVTVMLGILSLLSSWICISICCAKEKAKEEPKVELSDV